MKYQFFTVGQSYRNRAIRFHVGRNNECGEWDEAASFSEDGLSEAYQHCETLNKAVLRLTKK